MRLAGCKVNPQEAVVAGVKLGFMSVQVKRLVSSMTHASKQSKLDPDVQSLTHVTQF